MLGRSATDKKTSVMLLHRQGYMSIDYKRLSDVFPFPTSSEFSCIWRQYPSRKHQNNWINLHVEKRPSREQFHLQVS